METSVKGTMNRKARQVIVRVLSLAICVASPILAANAQGRGGDISPSAVTGHAPQCGLQRDAAVPLRIEDGRVGYVEPQLLTTTPTGLLLAGHPALAYHKSSTAAYGVEQFAWIGGASIGTGLTSQSLPPLPIDSNSIRVFAARQLDDGVLDLLIGRYDGHFTSSRFNSSFVASLQNNEWTLSAPMPFPSGRVWSLGAIDVFSEPATPILIVGSDKEDGGSELSVIRWEQSPQIVASLLWPLSISYLSAEKIGNKLYVLVVSGDSQERQSRNTLFMVTYDFVSGQWGRSVRLIRGANLGVDHPRIRADSNGRLFVVWQGDGPENSVPPDRRTEDLWVAPIISQDTIGVAELLLRGRIVATDVSAAHGRLWLAVNRPLDGKIEISVRELGAAQSSPVYAETLNAIVPNIRIAPTSEGLLVLWGSAEAPDGIPETQMRHFLLEHCERSGPGLPTR